jgi:predicted GNAT family acetyltransferase
MEIKHYETSQKGSFFAEQDGIVLGEMNYTFSGFDRIIIDTVVVTNDVRGKGIGNQLIDAIVSYARDNGFMIYPMCSFARSVLDRMIAYHDVYLR